MQVQPWKQIDVDQRRMMKMMFRDQLRAKGLSALAAAMLACMLAGCGSGMNTVQQSTVPVAKPSGRVFGGQQPISGAAIQLYAVGTTGYQSTSTPLLTQTVTTDSNGAFTLTGFYGCAGVTEVYLTATGGNSGNGTNTAINLMAGLGPCASLTGSTFINVNELTTVASVAALAPYMGDYQHIGAPNTAAGALGLANAFATVNNLVNISTGSAPGPTLPANAIAPVSELNTLADILSSCVNSTGSASSACSALFAATGASETTGAALGIATNPGLAANTALISWATGAGAAFQPSFSSAPNDWTLALKYSSSNFSTPYGLAVDAQGDVWVANESGNNITELNPAGSVLANYNGGGILLPRGIAIDTAGNVWVANTGGSSVVKLSSAGSPLSGTAGYTAGSINAPVALAIDSGNNVWVANFNGNSVTALSSTGSAINSSPLTGSGNLSLPTGIAVDTQGNVWVSSAGNGTVAEFSHLGILQSNSGYTDGALIDPQGLAMDANNNAFVAASFISAVSGFNSSGSALSPSPFTGGGIQTPAGVATDGAGAIWVVNAATSGSLSGIGSGLGGTLSPAAGYGALNTPVAVAIDPSGNVWTANSGDNSVTQFVGLATPVTTPLAANVGP
jgi:hypothetical protein